MSSPPSSSGGVAGRPTAAPRCARLAGAAALVAATAACAAPPAHRYHEAVSGLRDGHSRAYYDAMVRLAAEAPGERAGRRARAVLLGASGPGELAGAISGAQARLALATPTDEAGGASVGTPGQGAVELHEPLAQLRELAEMQATFHTASGRYCRDFTECEFTPPAPAHYYYFLNEHAVAGGSDSQRTVEAEAPIRAWLRGRRLLTPPSARHYRIVAVGLIGEEGVDVWTIDHRRQVVHLNDDPRPPKVGEEDRRAPIDQP